MCSCVEDILVHGTFAEVKGRFRVPFLTVPCFPPIVRDRVSHWRELHQGGLREPAHEFPGIHLEAPAFYLPISGSTRCAATSSFDLVCRLVLCQFNTQSYLKGGNLNWDDASL